MMRLLLLVSGVLLSSATLIDFVAVGERRFYCGDQQHWVGDCVTAGCDRPGASGYGYHRDEGRSVGRGFYTLSSDYDAELVCDFQKDGGVSGEVTNIAWVKMSDGSPRSRSGQYRHGGDGRRNRRRFRRSGHGDAYDSQYHHSSIVITRAERSTYYIRDYTAADFGTYRCFGTGADDSVVFMEVKFDPQNSSRSKVTDIVFTSQNAF